MHQLNKLQTNNKPDAALKLLILLSSIPVLHAICAAASKLTLFVPPADQHKMTAVLNRRKQFFNFLAIILPQ
jgi:uncharacterized lipoprotein YajG